MKNHTLRHGTTLIELAVALTLVATLTLLAVPPLRRTTDRIATRNARDALAASVARTRALAIARGSATLTLDPARGQIRIEAPVGVQTGPPLDLATRHRVRVKLEHGTTDPVTLHFDSRGLGRMANRTVHLHRGVSRASLTLSMYGRARRW